ncbi:hypothetical protein RN001_007459 [Aquatica leii]|uniref:Uncharacterized protein n=1 Tax=Aquatica leii TaxID=1421715 RepID=A0AAN7SNW0_9COLE|nr:hypothetical protein RN001_007459 [Aquatica leii]
MASIHIRVLIVFLIIIFTTAKNLPDIQSSKDNQELVQPATSQVVSTFLDRKKNLKGINETNQSEKSKCECGVFNTQKPTETDKAILSEAPIDVSCDHTGEENCAQLCSALAQAFKEEGPRVMCSALGHFENLKASIHSRICGAKWMFTGLTAPHYICCHEHQAISCNDKN